MNRFVADELTRTHKERRDWWSELSKDTGIDPAKNYVFDIRTRSIVEQKKPDPPSPQEGGEAHE
jgi:hypothetical protein